MRGMKKRYTVYINMFRRLMMPKGVMMMMPFHQCFHVLLLLVHKYRNSMFVVMSSTHDFNEEKGQLDEGAEVYS